jgi:hypothetical protein
MLIRLGYELVFQVPARTPMVLMLYTHPSRAASLRMGDWIRVEPHAPIEIYTDSFGNYCGRLVAYPDDYFRVSQFFRSAPLHGGTGVATGKTCVWCAGRGSIFEPSRGCDTRSFAVRASQRHANHL